MKRDRADNALTFSYDAGEGRITNATSSKPPISRGDHVDYTTIIDESATAGRLVGRIILRLTGERVVKYDGTFTYTVKDSAGDVAFSGTRDRRFTLRPKAGRRSKSMQFSFALPSGDYEVTARFAAASE
jgi:hypothetical protein